MRQSAAASWIGRVFGGATSPIRIVLVAILLSAPVGPLRAAEPYLTSDVVDLAGLLAPPPVVGSDAEKSEMRVLVEAQAHRTDAAAEEARADSTRSVFRFAAVFGPSFTEQALPVTKVLFKEVAVETEDLTDVAKAVFQRPRPFAVNPDLKPILVIPADGSRPTGQSPSYPSGHSVFATTTAILLAAAVPEKKAEIFARATIFAHNRIVAGVHYPSDIEGGRISGTVIAYALLHTPRFQVEFAKARAEIRQAVGLN